MQSRKTVTLSHSAEGIQIPMGDRVTIPEGTRVLITQSLGGSHTVMTERGAMFRIEEQDADALGMENAEAADAVASEATLEEQVWEQMQRCYDPEIPVNIVDLGLVYDCRVENEGDAEGATVRIQMTLTAPGCGMGPVLAEDVKGRLEALPDVGDAEVEIVLDPPWNQNMMSEAARLQLGFY